MTETTELEDLRARTAKYRHRAQRATLGFLLALALSLGVVLASGFYAYSFHDVPNLQHQLADQQRLLARQGRKTNAILAALQAAEAQRQCTSADQRLAFATILDLLGDGFGTPPAPDADRLRVVDGFHAAADVFRQPPPTPPTTCPPGG